MRLDYLRISLTDRCNLNCIYCRPGERIKILQKEELLSFEEIIKFIRLILPWGLKKVRITGGEPLIRKDVLKLISMIARIGQIKDIAMTTNGIVLEKFARDLKKAGLSRVNISLDTLSRGKFIRITGYDRLAMVLRGIRAAKDAGLEPVKINMVVLKGINDAEVLDFVSFAKENSLIPRFIEYMPINGAGMRDWYISNQVIKKIIEKKWGKLESVPFPGSGPAEYFKIKGISFTLGFISPISKPFCSTCSKLRLSADGKLKPCLASSYEIDIKRVLRESGQETRIEGLINSVIKFKKKKRSHLPDFNAAGKFMFQIGG